ncbi:hypothetical protein D3C87_1750290 [compost metagenome]
MPVIAPDLKAISSPAARLCEDACAVRTLARTETCMPIKPAAPDRTAPIIKPKAAVPDRSSHASMATTTPTAAIVMYWRVR